jgi:transcriptional regulator with XRE-family HTH domain
VDERLAAAVGERVRGLRTRAGKSVREQARDLGISASSLSMLENSRGGISLQRLQEVAAHFGLTLTDLLSEPRDGAVAPQPIEVLRGREHPAGVERGQGTLYQLLGTAPGHQLQPYVLSFQPGGGYEEDTIAHTGEEFAYVVFGEVELLYGEERIALAAGDATRFRTETPHAFRNASAHAVAIVVGAATPPW